MDFFGRQVATRRLSRRLVVLFLVAVLAVVVAVDAVVLGVLGLLQADSGGLVPADWIGRNADVAMWTTFIVCSVIAIASLYKTATLSQGGGAVARSLGGEIVTADSTDPLRRRLLNVVEEMAIASGVPMPAVYVLEQETGINAFAAGHNPGNAAIAVTRGALTRLDRAELQGVIAHEFSHILNGDMRLNIRMMGLLFGLLAISVIARLVLRHGPRGGGKKGGGIAVVMLAALAVMVLGYIGLFFGRLLQAAISRSRESLADASAIQFTRDPGGLRGALVKIGATSAGSRIVDADAEEVAHMLFAPGVSRLFATHPPLLERIRTLDPGFDVRDFEKARARMQAEEIEAAPPAAPTAAERLEQLINPTVAVIPAAVAQLVGNPGTAHVMLAQALRQSLPEDIRAAAQTPRQAAALLLAFALDSDQSIRERQFAIVGEQLGPRAAQAVDQWLLPLGRLQPLQRLPAFLRLFPAIQSLSRGEKEKLGECLKRLLPDARYSLHAYVLGRLARVQLQDELEPVARARRRTLESVSVDLQVLFSVLASQGHPDATDARRAYEIGMHHLLPRDRPVFAPPARWPEQLDIALGRLDELQPPAKEQLIEALVKTVANDLRLTVEEAELLRTVCAILHCPLPPLVAEADLSG